jgi:hypothetical protein
MVVEIPKFNTNNCRESIEIRSVWDPGAGQKLFLPPAEWAVRQLACPDGLAASGVPENSMLRIHRQTSAGDGAPHRER